VLSTENRRTSPDPEEETDVPGLATWPRVYVFVLGAFLLWILLLTALMRTFS
jgi:hypothetical protein